MLDNTKEYSKTQVDSVLTSYYSWYKNVGSQTTTVSNKEYNIGSNQGLLFIYGWKTDGNGYCQLYLISPNPRSAYAVATLVSYGGESPITSSFVTSNYANGKIKVTTSSHNAYIKFLGL